MRKFLIILLTVCITAAAGYASYRGYRHWRQTNLVKLARKFIKDSDPQNAALCLQRAIQANPKDLEACRLIANLAEAGRSPSALMWRSRVVDLNTNSLEDRLAWARTALTFRDYASATNALGGVDDAGKRTAAYHNLAGTVASTLNQLAQAEAHFLEASRLDPTNPAPQLNLAVVQLRRTDTNIAAQARASLEGLRTNTVVRREVLRELTVDALRQKQTNSALALSQELVQQTNSVFADRMLRLEVLRETRNPEFNSALSASQREATNSSANIHELVMWQMAKGAAPEALTWLQTLPMVARTNQPVALLAAECQAMTRDWAGLQASLEGQNWGELEFIRFAFRALALRKQEMTAASKAEWENAVKATENRRERLVSLGQLAAQWGWPTETEAILWTIIDRYPAEKWAFGALDSALTAGGRTRGLLTLYGKIVETDPASIGAKNNLAMMALLLNATDRKPHDLAQEVYAKAPTNVAYASTYAFSLLVQEKSAEALKILEQFKPEQLEEPAVAGYYGLALQAAGNSAKAKKYLDLSATAKLLPEERKLIEKAKAGG